jgi:hypothetical protein
MKETELCPASFWGKFFTFQIVRAEAVAFSVRYIYFTSGDILCVGTTAWCLVVCLVLPPCRGENNTMHEASCVKG